MRSSAATETATVCAKIGVCEVLMLLVLLVGLAATVLAPDLDMPSAPELYGDASADSITVLWNAPIAGCFAGTCKYQLEMKKHITVASRHQTRPQTEWKLVEDGVVEFDPPQSIFKHKVGGLEHNQPYLFRVRHWVTDTERPGERGLWGPFSAPSGKIFAEPPSRNRFKNRNRKPAVDLTGAFRAFRTKLWSFVRGTLRLSVRSVHAGLFCILASFALCLAETHIPLVQLLDRVFSLPKLVVTFHITLAILVLAAVEYCLSDTRYMAPVVDASANLVSIAAVVASAGTVVSLLWWHLSRFDFWLFNNAPSFFVGVCFFSGVFWRLARPFVATHFHREPSPQTVALILFLSWIGIMLVLVLAASVATRTLCGPLGKKQGLVYR